MSDSLLCAVLTGDLIKSRQSDTAAVEQTFDILHHAAHHFGSAWDQDVRFTRYRGDGWQIVLTKPGLLLDAALYFIAQLKAGKTRIATRISVGVGTVETLGSRDLSDATGPAFFVSGDRLADMGRNRMIALAGHGISKEQVAIIDLAEWIAAGWTATQAEVIAIQLEGHLTRHEDIAEKLGVTRQAIQSRLAGAGLSYFDNALYAMRTHDYASH
ncbi:SatD family protein [Yoonia sp. GPGPB17]|uniref:SatD family protein n=1 Tax=Yoonia sp. GPGPB17 TaxID=3026147 RepID=UPI0030C2FD68